MMNEIIDAFTRLPAYIAELLNGPYLLLVVVLLFLFLTAMFFNRPWAHTMRVLIGAALIAGAIIAFVMKQTQLACLCTAALLVLVLYRLIVNGIIALHRRIVDSKIEKQALYRASTRRGNRMMRSNAVYPDENAAKTAASDGAAGPDDPASSAPPEEETEKIIPADQPLTRAQLTENLARLRDLRNAGILTEEEYNRKKTELYSRLG
jgi:hypothetical protein